MDSFTLGIVIVIIISVLVYWRNAGMGFEYDRPLNLTKEQTKKLALAKRSARGVVDAALRRMCKDKQSIIDRIETMDMNMSCTQIRGSISRMLADAHISPYEGVSVNAAVKSAIQVWADKALSQYCQDTLDKEKFKTHMIWAVGDICEPNGDFAQMLYMMSDYVVTKPLSIMS